MPDDDLRQRLDAAINLLDDAQRRRLLGWAGSMQRAVEDARAPGTSIGPLAEMLHITNLGVSDGHARYRLDVAPELVNPHGLLHGGAVYTMIDYSMGGVTMAALPAGEICATIEIKVSYFAGVRGGALTCDTSIVKQGKNAVFLESKVTDERGTLVAAATGSFAVIRLGGER
ncbi:MAG: PaaI family thioesterase [Chloroflexota bacterium]|nr:PaaI family thioesterase [Chloroflexota bacterium]